MGWSTALMFQKTDHSRCQKGFWSWEKLSLSLATGNHLTQFTVYCFWSLTYQHLVCQFYSVFKVFSANWTHDLGHFTIRFLCVFLFSSSISVVRISLWVFSLDLCFWIIALAQQQLSAPQGRNGWVQRSCGRNKGQWEFRPEETYL